MTKEQLISAMKELAEHRREDPEVTHIDVDKLLLIYIDDAEVTRLHYECAAWYA